MSSKQRSSTKYGTLGSLKKRIRPHKVRFYHGVSGREPVRVWLKQLDPTDRKQIGEDLYTLQLGWPLGMPLARKLKPDLWELRCNIRGGIARILFTVAEHELLLLNGFIKKSQKLPPNELAVAMRRLNTLKTWTEQ